jgi:hypothetical protein
MRFIAPLVGRIHPTASPLWAQARGINDASRGSLNSYTYGILAIHYLQVGSVRFTHAASHAPVLCALHTSERARAA